MPHKFTEAIFRAKLPLVEKMILWVLSEHANANGVAWPGQSRIAALAGCDYTTVALALKRLEAQGLITHIGSHDSPRGPVKKFALNMKRILALGAVGAWPTVGGGGTVGGATEKPNNSQIRAGDDFVTETEAQNAGGSGVSPDGLADVVSTATIAIADAANDSLRSHETEEQHQEPQLNTRDSVPNPADDLPVPLSSGIEDSAKSENPSPASPFSRKGDPARWLANYLWMYLSVRPEVEIPYSWETYWSLDFQDAFDRGWELEQLEPIVQASQYGAARAYYVRAKSICYDENLKRLEKIADYLSEKGLLQDVVCLKCKAFFPDTDLMVEHYWASHAREVDPDDVAEEEAMWLADELISEGYVREHPEMEEYYPWPAEDWETLFDPLADTPERLAPPPVRELMPYLQNCGLGETQGHCRESP